MPVVFRVPYSLKEYQYFMLSSVFGILQHNLRRGWGKNKTHGRGHKGQGQRMTLPKLGFETGHKPFYLRVPQEYYYEGHQYV